MSNKKAQAFLQKKKEAVKGKMKERKERGGEGRDTSKMPEGLRKHFEGKQKGGGEKPEGRQRPEGREQRGGRGGQMPPQRRRQMAQARRRRQG